MNTRTGARLLKATLTLSLAAGVIVAAAPGAYAATRDIRVHFTNDSDSDLTLTSQNLDHGCWNVSPPAKIAIGATVDIASESCGFATGTEFHLTYTLDNGGATTSLHYDNPFSGSDSFDETAPSGYQYTAGGVIEDRTDRFSCTSQTCDGIPDAWKRNGVTIDPGGGRPPQLVDLPDMGVTISRPTVLVQMDWMADTAHDQHLAQAAIDTVIKAFDQDPVTYRGATQPGITLRVDNGPDSTITPGGVKWGALSRAHAIPWVQDFLGGSRSVGYQFKNFYDRMKSDFVPTGRLPIFHYAVAAAELSAGGTSTGTCYGRDDTSGVTPGDLLGFIVSLGDWTGCVGTQAEQTGTFMHEFGHALGLDHSGGEGNADSVNHKPNYPSVMNYSYQTKGVFRGGTQVFDFSRDGTIDVDESKLTEADGVDLGGNPSGYGTAHSCGTKDPTTGKISLSTYIQAGLKPVDWNCDTKSTAGTGFDGNGDLAQTVLHGAPADWNRIRFKTGGVGAGEDAKDVVTIPGDSPSPPFPETTYTEQRNVRTLPLTASVAYTGAASGDYHDPAAFSATLTDPEGGNAPVAGRTLVFKLGSSATDVCSAVTDASGNASCGITPTQAAAVYPATISFAGDDVYKALTDSTHTFTVTKEETTLAYTGDMKFADGSPAHLGAVLKEDGQTPIAGAAVTLAVGGGTAQQSCSASTDASGVAACTIASLAQPLSAAGTLPISASFAGDPYYLASSTSATGLLNYMTGRAFGLSADVRLLLSLVHVPPTPDTGPVRTASGTTTGSCAVSVSTLVITAHSLCADVTVTVAPGTSVGTATVQDVTIGVPGLPVITAKAIRSVSTSTCSGSSGSVTIGSLTIGGVPVTVNAAPNTTVNVGVAKLVLDEQVPVPGADHGLTVNALHLTGLGGAVDVVVGSSTSDIHNC